MTPTEKLAEQWLRARGLNPVFHRKDSPDFTTEEGGYEVKLVQGHQTISFSRGQLKRLQTTKSKILLYAQNTPLPTILNATDLQEGDNPAYHVFVGKGRIMQCDDSAWVRITKLKQHGNFRTMGDVVSYLLDEHEKSIVLEESTWKAFLSLKTEKHLKSMDAVAVYLLADEAEAE